MVRWIVVLLAACLLSGLVGFGGLGFATAGLAQTLLAIFAGLLCISLVVGIIRGG